MIEPHRITRVVARDRPSKRLLGTATGASPNGSCMRYCGHRWGQTFEIHLRVGFQWKSLFLPDGTEVRMQYKSVWYYAKVEGDKLIYEGEPITPGRLANTVSGTSRNAWRDLWIKRPADFEWLLADDCRGDGEQG